MKREVGEACGVEGIVEGVRVGCEWVGGGKGIAREGNWTGFMTSVSSKEGGCRALGSLRRKSGMSEVKKAGGFISTKPMEHLKALS